MFHVNPHVDATDLAEAVEHLANLTEALASGYDLPDDCLAQPTCASFRALGSTIVKALNEIGRELSRREHASRKAPIFDFSTPAVPSPDLPEPVHPDGFVFPAKRATAIPRDEALTRAMQGYLLGRKAAELEALSAAASGPLVAMVDRDRRLDAVMSALDTATWLVLAREGSNEEAAPRLTVDKHDEEWLDLLQRGLEAERHRAGDAGKRVA